MQDNRRAAETNDAQYENFGTIHTPESQDDIAPTDSLSDAVEAIMDNLTPGDQDE